MLSAPPCQVSSGPGLYVTSDNDSSGTSHHSQAPTHTFPLPAELPRGDADSLLSSPGPPPSPPSPPGFLAWSSPYFWRGLWNSSLSLGSHTEELTASKWHVPPASKGTSLLPTAGPPQGPPSTQFFPLRAQRPSLSLFPQVPWPLPQPPSSVANPLLWSSHDGGALSRVQKETLRDPLQIVLPPGDQALTPQACKPSGPAPPAHGCQAGLGGAGPEGGRSPGLLFLWLLRENGAQSSQLIPWPHFRDEQLWPRKQ